MRSGISFFDLTTFKKTVARFWPLWAAYSALWLIVLPLQGMMLLRMDASDHNGFGSYMETFARVTVPNAAEDSARILAVMFGVLAAMAVFSHLYNARSANLFGSLPIRREGLFLTHYLAGLSFVLVPNVVIFLLTLLVEGLGGCVCMEGLWFWLAASCGEYFFFYSLAVFCAMFTGHVLALPAFYAVVNVFAYGVTGLFYLTLNHFYYGFAGFSAWVEDVVKWLTPAYALNEKVGYYWDGAGDQLLHISGWGALAAYAGAALALSACAFFLYRARRLESAGDVVSVRPMRPVFKYGVALCVGMVFGVGTSFFLGGGEFTLMAAIVVWGVIGCFAAQMLLDKSFRVFKKWKGAAAVAAVFAALFLVVGFDLTGYETRVPDAADVKSVYVSGLSVVNYADEGDLVALDIDDPGQIGLLTALHRAAVEDRGDRGHTGKVASCLLELTYTLNNGSTLRRAYYMDIDPAQVDTQGSGAWAMEQLYHDTDLYWRAYGFDELEGLIAKGYRLESAEFRTYDDGQGQMGDVVAYGGDARTLLDAVEEDFKAGRIGVRTVTDPRAVNGGHPLDSLMFRVVDPATGNSASWLEIALQDTASSTRDVLARLALESQWEDRADATVREALDKWVK